MKVLKIKIKVRFVCVCVCVHFFGLTKDNKKPSIAKPVIEKQNVSLSGVYVRVRTLEVCCVTAWTADGVAVLTLGGCEQQVGEVHALLNPPPCDVCH